MFHRWKEEQIISKTCIICSTTLKVSYALPVENLSLNLRLIANVVFDESKKILSYSSADNAIVSFTKAARKVRLLPIYTLEDAYNTTRQLHRQ